MSGYPLGETEASPPRSFSPRVRQPQPYTSAAPILRSPAGVELEPPARYLQSHHEAELAARNRTPNRRNSSGAGAGLTPAQAAPATARAAPSPRHTPQHYPAGVASAEPERYDLPPNANAATPAAGEPYDPSADSPHGGSGGGGGNKLWIAIAILLAAVLFGLLLQRRTVIGVDDAGAGAGSTAASSGGSGTGARSSAVLSGDSLEAELVTTASHLESIMFERALETSARALADARSSETERERALEVRTTAGATEEDSGLAAYRTIKSLGDALEAKVARKQTLLSARKTAFQVQSAQHASAQSAIDNYLKVRSGLKKYAESLTAAHSEWTARQTDVSTADGLLREFLSKLSNQDVALESLRDRVSSHQIAVSEASDKLAHQREIVSNLRSALVACDREHSAHAPPSIARLVNARDTVIEERQQLLTAQAAVEQKLTKQKLALNRVQTKAATVLNLRQLLDELASIGGKVGSVRDLLAQQRAELDLLHNQAKQLHSTGSGGDAPPAAAATDASDDDGDADDPLLRQALAMSESVKARTIADAKRNIELLEGLTAGVDGRGGAVDIHTLRQQLMERATNDESKIAAARNDISVTERELNAAIERVKVAADSIESLNSELSGVQKAAADHTRCKSDTQQQLQLSEDFQRSLEVELNRKTALRTEAEGALRTEETTKHSSDSVEATHRAAVTAARARARTAESEVAKQLQFLQLKLDAAADARRAADAAIRLHQSTAAALIEEQNAIAAVQTEIDGLIQALSSRIVRKP